MPKHSAILEAPMSPLIKRVLLFCLAVAPGIAGTIFQGVFPSNDQVALFNIMANSAEIATIQTHSYGGGTVNSTPAAFLFANLRDVLTLNTGNSSQVAQYPTTGKVTTTWTPWARVHTTVHCIRARTKFLIQCT